MRRVIWLQTPAVFWLGGGNISRNYLMYVGFMMLGTKKYTAEPLVSEPSAYELELANHKSSRITNHQVSNSIRIG